MVDKLQGFYHIISVHGLSISWVRGKFIELGDFLSIYYENYYCSMSQLFQMSSQYIFCSLSQGFGGELSHNVLKHPFYVAALPSCASRRQSCNIIGKIQKIIIVCFLCFLWGTPVRKGSLGSQINAGIKSDSHISTIRLRRVFSSERCWWYTV